MPLISVNTPAIVIPIPDFVIGDTIIKRTATLFTMIYNQSIKELVLTWTVKHYAKDGENVGDYLGKDIPDWSKQSVADNSTMCDAATGVPIEKINLGTEEEPVMEYPNINYMGQYDFFWGMAEQHPIVVHSLIRQFGGLVQSWEKK